MHDVCGAVWRQAQVHSALCTHAVDELSFLQFHTEPVSAVDACYQGDVVIILPGVYSVSKPIFLPDSITIEGKKNKNNKALKVP